MLLDLTYSYDAVSNVTGLTDATPTRNESLNLRLRRLEPLDRGQRGYAATYAYDQLDRLTIFTEGKYTTTFGFWLAMLVVGE